MKIIQVSYYFIVNRHWVFVVVIIVTLIPIGCWVTYTNYPAADDVDSLLMVPLILSRHRITAFVITAGFALSSL